MQFAFARTWKESGSLKRRRGTERPQPKVRVCIPQRKTSATDQRLFRGRQRSLQSGFGAIVDATFLKAEDRLRFHRLAESEHADFRILDFQADKETLKRRLTQRRLSGKDASDATLDILESQLQYQEPLTPEEQAWVVPDRSLTRRLGPRIKNQSTGQPLIQNLRDTARAHPAPGDTAFRAPGDSTFVQVAQRVGSDLVSLCRFRGPNSRHAMRAKRSK